MKHKMSELTPRQRMQLMAKRAGLKKSESLIVYSFQHTTKENHAKPYH